MWFTSPKNFKSGRLISNKFTLFDLVFMIAGIGLTFVLEAIYVIFFLSESTTVNMTFLILLTLPGIIAFALVQPSGIYHNFMTFFHLLFISISEPKSYIWGGLYRNDYEEEETDID